MDFEKAFEEILEQDEYDRAEEALFQIARAAFCSGWHAARRFQTLDCEKAQEILDKGQGAAPGSNRFE
ncbi:MAG: hypothetical protein AB7C89_01540 [Intestinibacillus sp.]